MTNVPAFDPMRASFPEDITTRVERIQVEQAHFNAYSENHLWLDGTMKLATLPKYETFSSTGLVMRPEDFADHLFDYWTTSTFKRTEGSPVIFDMVFYLGRERSGDDLSELAAFKSITTTLIQHEIESMARFDDVHKEYISFFHMLEADGSGAMNFHTHNLILLK